MAGMSRPHMCEDTRLTGAALLLQKDEDHIDKMETTIGLAPPGATVVLALLDSHALGTQITTLVRLGRLGDTVAVLLKMLPWLYCGGGQLQARTERSKGPGSEAVCRQA